MLQKILATIRGHKISAAIILIAFLGGGYYLYSSLTGAETTTSYVLAAAEKGSIISSISGTGQISVSNQVEIKPKASGEITYLAVKNGQEVKAGALLAQIDSSEAQKSVRDAEANLASAKIALAKLETPADELSVMQAENSLASAKESQIEAAADLQKAYEDGFNDVANAFLELPTVMAGLEDILYSQNFNVNQDNINYYTDSAYTYDTGATLYQTSADTSYQAARTAYDDNYTDYKSTSRLAGSDATFALIIQTYETTQKISEAIKNTNNLIQFYKDKLVEHNLTPPTLASTHLTSLNSYTSKINTQLSALLAIKQTIVNDQQTITTAQRTIAEKTQSLADLKAGTDELDLQSQKISLKQKENALLDAKEQLADYSVRAPFAGVVATVNAAKGDTASSGASILTLITKQKLAEISLNEVDAAKVAVGQKATLTFDAIEDLTISGEVAEVDALGTVSSGVVTYNIKISFDTQDDRIKSGMTVTAAIITSVKQDILMVPNAAVKTDNQGSYVQMPNETVDQTAATANSGITLNNTPKQQTVEIGEANDTTTEITSGLNEGDLVITRTVTGSSTTTTTTNGGTSRNSVSNILNGGGGGGPRF